MKCLLFAMFLIVNAKHLHIIKTLFYSINTRHRVTYRGVRNNMEKQASQASEIKLKKLVTSMILMDI